jgi:phosphatidylserine/phosphatidylglycerophosphate/cardiolipin synthase-like enzyme
MVRDGRTAFVGSQSLRSIELDARREVGLIFRDRKAVARIRETFLSDWKDSEAASSRTVDDAPAARVAKRVAKVLARELPPVAPLLNGAVKELTGEAAVDIDPEEVESAVRRAVKQAVRQAVGEVVGEVVEGQK